MQAGHDRDRLRLFAFDVRALTEISEEFKRGLDPFRTTVATSMHVK